MEGREGVGALLSSPDEDYPADPYPGVAPGFSHLHLDATARRLDPDPAARGGWRCDGADLDAWLADRGAAPMAARVPVLTFGSNRCPSKITWLREHLGLDGPVVVLRATVAGLAAVWAAGRRARDGARPATLAVAPGTTETHAVWMATPGQVAVLDTCEGRGERYDLVRLRAGTVTTEDAAELDGVWTYWPAGPERAPLLVGGAPVRCADVDQARARELVGVPAAVPRAAATPWAGPPDPDGWPREVFTYGTLQPGRSAWHRVARHVVGRPRTATMPGRVHDTGRGYPALLAGPPGLARGTVLTLADPAAAMPALDAYEGPEYVRVRAVVRPDDGSAPLPAWVWVWRGTVDGWPRVDGPWADPG